MKNKNALVIGLVVALVLLCCCCLAGFTGYYFYMSQNSSTTITPFPYITTTPTPTPITGTNPGVTVTPTATAQNNTTFLGTVKITFPNTVELEDKFSLDADSLLDECYRDSQQTSCEVVVLKDTKSKAVVNVSTNGAFIQSSGYIPLITKTRGLDVNGKTYTISVNYLTPNTSIPHSFNFCINAGTYVCFSSDFSDLSDSEARIALEAAVNIIENISIN